jgi:hypothetical protein
MHSAKAERSYSASQRIVILHHQCAWCGLVEDGPFADQRLPIIDSYTHGACGPCRRAWLAEYEAAKRAQDAK